MSFKIRNGDFERIVNTEALSRLCAKEGLPARISFPLAMVMTDIGTLLQDYLKTKESLIKKFEKEACSKRDEDGKPIRTSFDTNHPGFQIEWIEFMNLEIELRGDPITIDLVELEEKSGITISPADQVGMRPIVNCTFPGYEPEEEDEQVKEDTEEDLDS